MIVLLCVVLYAIGQGIRIGTSAPDSRCRSSAVVSDPRGRDARSTRGDLFNCSSRSRVLLAASFVLAPRWERFQ